MITLGLKKMNKRTVLYWNRHIRADVIPGPREAAELSQVRAWNWFWGFTQKIKAILGQLMVWNQFWGFTQEIKLVQCQLMVWNWSCGHHTYIKKLNKTCGCTWSPLTVQTWSGLIAAGRLLTSVIKGFLVTLGSLPRQDKTIYPQSCSDLDSGAFMWHLALYQHLLIGREFVLALRSRRTGWFRPGSKQNLIWREGYSWSCWWDLLAERHVEP